MVRVTGNRVRGGALPSGSTVSQAIALAHLESRHSPSHCILRYEWAKRGEREKERERESRVETWQQQKKGDYCKLWRQLADTNRAFRLIATNLRVVDFLRCLKEAHARK